VISNFYRESVQKKFGDFWYRSVGGFFFLRFISPAFVTPKNYGLVDSLNLTANCSKTLTLCTKILQLVANRKTFNDHHKVLNDYIESKFDEIDSIFEEISVIN
jgi:hypothetical protein